MPPKGNGQVKNPVSQTPHKPKLGVNELLEMVLFTPAVENAINAYKDEKPDAEIQIREAVCGVLREALCGDLLRDTAKSFDGLTETINAQTETISELIEAADEDGLGAFLVSGALEHRYENDHAEEKRRAATYVAQTFFNDQRAFCFVQASITAIHLAQQLAQRQLVAGSLFYTNSIVFPLVMLQKHPEVSVYAFCGTDYDNLCGGWLPRHDDLEARKYLESLFNRGETSLQDAIVTPIALSCDTGDLFFTRSELISMVEVLARQSKRVIVMTFTSRIFGSSNDAQNGFLNSSLHGFSNGGNWRVGDQPAQLVIARDDDALAGLDWGQSLEMLHQRGFDVHWQDAELQWQVARCDDSQS